MTRGRNRCIDVPISDLHIHAYEIPTDFPEEDGTLRWDATTIVVVRAFAGDAWGLGYTYSDAAAGRLIVDVLRDVVIGRDACWVPATWRAMHESIRNLGQSGMAMSAIAAVDVALWDLKARLLDVSMVVLLGRWHESVPVYGSGGFTSYPIERLQDQLAGWVEMGIPRVKMKVGRDPQADVERVRAVRKAIGDDVELFVDANGAFDTKQALRLAYDFADHGVVWFEEPVPSPDLRGLRLIRRRSPAGMDIAAGEYGYSLRHFIEMIEAEAVDVIQPDVTRCGGITAFSARGPLCEAHHVPLSAHTAPQLDAHVGAAVAPLRHVEYFHDHVRVEDMMFEGTLRPQKGQFHPDPSIPGLGLELKAEDVEHYLVYEQTTR